VRAFSQKEEAVHRTAVTPRSSRRDMLFSAATVGLVGAGLLEAGFPRAAEAFGAEIELSDLKYERVECPPNQYMPNKANTVCVMFTATANNSLKRDVEAANIFGFVDDQENNSAVTVNPTGTSRTVLAGVDDPIPPGKSQVTFLVTVYREQLDNHGPLKLKGFKAVPSLDKIEKRFKSFGECDLDPYAEGCPDAL